MPCDRDWHGRAFSSTRCFSRTPVCTFVLSAQINADPYDKRGTLEGFYALQAEKDHGCIVIWCVLLPLVLGYAPLPGGGCTGQSLRPASWLAVDKGTVAVVVLLLTSASRHSRSTLLRATIVPCSVGLMLCSRFTVTTPTMASSYDMSITSTQCELCARDLSEFMKNEGLVRVSCDRLSGDHTTDCVCNVVHQSITRCGVGEYRAPYTSW